MSTALLEHEKLIKAIEAIKLTQEELAEEIGITDRHLRNLKEKDTDVSTSVLYRLRQTFQTSIESLLTFQESAKKKSIGK